MSEKIPRTTEFMIELDADKETVWDLWQAQPDGISIEETMTRAMPDPGTLITVFLVAKHGFDAVTAATKLGLLLSQILQKKEPKTKRTKLTIKFGNQIERTKIEQAFERIVERNLAVIEYEQLSEPAFEPMTTDVSALLRAANDAARQDENA